MKQAYQYTAHYNGRKAVVVAYGEHDAIQKAIEVFKPARHRQPAVVVEKGDPVTAKIGERND